MLEGCGAYPVPAAGGGPRALRLRSSYISAGPNGDVGGTVLSLHSGKYYNRATDQQSWERLASSPTIMMAR